MTTSTAPSSGLSMGATVKARCSIGQYPAPRGVTVTEAYRQEMRLKSEAAAHKKIYAEGTPTVKEQAMALVRAYRRAGDHAALESFLHDVAHAGAPTDLLRPLGVEAWVRFAEIEAAEAVLRQSVSVVRCKGSFMVWCRRAYRLIAEIHDVIRAGKQEYGL